MKNAKRWLAILLAVTLLCSNGVSQLGMIVSASELETTEEAQPKEDAVVEQAEETHRRDRTKQMYRKRLRQR